uniref:Reverse transcriptase domain-containing protein n=1 Tax=Tanacetum cinerariifolium TaxID=118510 RepID=A0A6L2MP41_TANCI|nr:reverse transcriptase domain-containing protein [Tanacetum cinerariifolium]
MKKLILEQPTLTTPGLKETLYVYLAISKDAVSRVLIADRGENKRPFDMLAERCTRLIETTPHGEMGTLPITPILKLGRYFEAHPIKVITDQPIKQILNKLEVSGKLAKYAIELGAYNITYILWNAVKGQILADFLNEISMDTKTCGGAGLVLIDPVGAEYTYSIRLNFASTNNEAEYEALLEGLQIAEKIKVRALKVKVDSKLVACQLNGECVANKDENEERTLRMKIGQYTLVEGVLFKRPHMSLMMRCVGPISANYITREVHEGALGIHLRARSVVEKIMQQGYYWPSMHRDTKKGWFTEVIVTDNGTQLVNDPFKSWCEKWKIKQMNTTVAHLQANGLVEISNKSLMHGLKARLGRERVGWVDELPNILWAHQTMLKISSVETPFSLTYGSEAVILAEIGMPTYRIIQFNEAQNKKEMRLNLDLIQERRETAAIREAKYKKKMEQYYNKRVRPVSFKVGEFVYRRNEASRVENQAKLGPNWEGPYRVTEAYDNSSYKLCNMNDREVPRTWHAINLRNYFT